MEPSTRYTEEHYKYTEGRLIYQEPLQVEIEQIVKDALDVLGDHWLAMHRLALKPVTLLRFGSRQYGCALPTSDFDLVCEVPAGAFSDVRGASLQDFLERLMKQLTNDKRCRVIRDAISGKDTLVVKYACLTIDLTASIAPALDQHVPSKLTKWVKGALDELPRAARRLARLVVDVVKHNRACVNGGPARQFLKSVHWVLMVIAWWRHSDISKIVDSRSVEELLLDVMDFYARLDYRRVSILAKSFTPIVDRTSSKTEPEIMMKFSESPILLLDPLRKWQNLASHIDDVGVEHIIATLSRCWEHLQDSPETFWQRPWKTQPLHAECRNSMPQIVAVPLKTEQAALCILCKDKSEKLFQGAAMLCQEALRKGCTITEEDVNDESLKSAIVALDADFATSVRRIVVEGGRFHGLLAFGAGANLEKRSRAAKLAIATHVKVSMSTDGAEASTQNEDFDELVRTASLLLARNNASMQRSESADHEDVPNDWRKYRDPDSERVWYFNHRTHEAFFADCPDPWCQYTAPDGRVWWWHERGDCFFDDLCE